MWLQDSTRNKGVHNRYHRFIYLPIHLTDFLKHPFLVEKSKHKYVQVSARLPPFKKGMNGGLKSLGWLFNRTKPSHLVVFIQKSKSCHAVLVSIDAHHGLGGCGERVLQVGPPGFILTCKHTAGQEGRLIGNHYYQPLTVPQSTICFKDMRMTLNLQSSMKSLRGRCTIYTLAPNA